MFFLLICILTLPEAAKIILNVHFLTTSYCNMFGLPYGVIEEFSWLVFGRPEVVYLSTIITVMSGYKICNTSGRNSQRTKSCNKILNYFLSEIVLGYSLSQRENLPVRPSADNLRPW